MSYKTHLSKLKLIKNTTQYSLRILGCYVFCLFMSKDSRMYWFRLFGYGLTWKHIDNEMSFGERIGLRKFLKIGKYKFGFLTSSRANQK